MASNETILGNVMRLDSKAAVDVLNIDRDARTQGRSTIKIVTRGKHMGFFALGKLFFFFQNLCLLTIGMTNSVTRDSVRYYAMHEKQSRIYESG